MNEDNKTILFEQFANSVEKFYRSGMPYDQWKESVKLLYVAYCTATGRTPNLDLFNKKETTRT